MDDGGARTPRFSFSLVALVPNDQARRARPRPEVPALFFFIPGDSDADFDLYTQPNTTYTTLDNNLSSKQ